MRKKVVVAAYACEPDEGSEPGVGWHMCQAISREHEVWAITRSNNRNKIERALAENPNPNLHFAYADLPAWARFWKRGGRFTRTYYYLWQFAALRVACKLHKGINFDLAHHVTFVNNWMFTFLALLPIPFIWGPIGAHPPMPDQLVSDKWVLIKDRVRTLYLALFRILDPLYWLSAYRASYVIGIDQDACRHFPLSIFVSEKLVIHPAIGVESLFSEIEDRKPTSRPFRVLSMGRLVPLKGFHLAIRAFAKFLNTYPNAEMVIVGKGNGKPLHDLVDSLGVSDKVTFIDWLPREDALAEMGRSDVFLFPTFEGGGMVVLEAMAHGLPVVALDYGGPAAMASSDCAFLVQPGSFDATVDGLTRALDTLAHDPIARYRMGEAAIDCIRDRFLWSDRHVVIAEWYQGALKRLGDKRLD